MLFNSLVFMLFLPIVFGIYWALAKQLRWQNLWIFATSLFFYGWWDWRFLSLLIFTMTNDFLLGWWIDKTEQGKKRKWLLVFSIISNIGVLCVFKYYNFFLQSWADLWALFDVKISFTYWQMILPIGISFYTFHSLSYTIDIYRRKLIHTKDYIAFGAFITFFPQLVAGPIARATQLLPQFMQLKKFNFEYAKDGFRQMLWGLFKKVVVADTLAMFVDDIFSHQQQMPGSMMWLGSLYFAIQVYADFSGYSDMAIGIAKMFGISLMKNFSLPFFSNNMAEFWHKWHISLSTWFRDYVYFPLGGSQKGKLKYIFNLSVVFALSGLWHGPKWNYIWWGLLNVLYIAPVTLLFKSRNKEKSLQKKAYTDIPAMLFTLILFTFSVGVFRTESTHLALSLPSQLFHFDTKFITFFFDSIERYALEGLLFVILLFFFEWTNRTKEHPLQGKHAEWKAIIILAFILVLGIFSDYKAFIYFQF